MTVSGLIASGLELSARLRASGQHEDGDTVQRLTEAVTAADMRLRAEELDDLPTCPVCNGRGAVAKIVARSKVYSQCPRCKGLGKASE